MISRFVVMMLLLLWAVASVAIAHEPQKVQELSFTTFSVTYDNSLGIPVYVQWDITPSDLGMVKREPSWGFRQDRRIPKPCATSSDYTRSGYQRGHMCPAADRSSSVAKMKETFTMANICPQSPALNCGRWLQSEERARYLARQLGKVHVRVAPLFFHMDTTFIGRHRVAVPHGFIKVIYMADSVTAIHTELFTNQNLRYEDTQRNKEQ